MNSNGDPLFAEKIRIRQLSVRKHLLLILILDLRVKIAGPLLGRFKCSDAEGFVNRRLTLRGKGRVQIDKGSSHLAPVAEFNGPLPQPAARHDANGVCGAAVNLDKGDQALAIRTFRVIDPKTLTAKHRHPDAQDLTGAEVPMGNFGFAQESIKGLHKLMILPETRAMFSRPLHDVARGRYYSRPEVTDD